MRYTQIHVNSSEVKDPDGEKKKSKTLSRLNVKKKERKTEV